MTEEEHATIACRIRDIRLGQCLTQAELGAKVGRSGNSISDYETGRYWPPAEVLEQIAETFGVTYAYLTETKREVGNA